MISSRPGPVIASAAKQSRRTLGALRPWIASSLRSSRGRRRLYPVASCSNKHDRAVERLSTRAAAIRSRRLFVFLERFEHGVHADFDVFASSKNANVDDIVFVNGDFD